MPLPPKSWREMDDRTREREYSPSSRIGGDYRPFVAAYAQRSAQARSRTEGQLGLRYGPGAAQTLDLFVPPTSGELGCALPPLLVFIHGGYWQELSKDDSSFAAASCVAQGIGLAVPDYTLAPAASLADIVAECRAALAWLHHHGAALGFDARRIVVAGSSAGAHLAAMAALPSRRPAAESAPPSGRTAGESAIVRGAVLVSGIYELEPLIGTSINRALRLTADAARVLSPMLAPLQGFPPGIVCWGELETCEFERQSLAFAARLRRAGTACEVFKVPRRNHFDVILDLADADTALGAATIALVRSI